MVTERQRDNEKVRRAFAKKADVYDRQISFFERRMFGTDHRAWACGKAAGETLEVAVGTGLNLPHYAAEAKVTGIDLTEEMVDIATERARELGLDVELRQGDAHDLPFQDASFDSVVCTYALCGIPDPQRAVGEMKRVLRLGGRLILVDHVESPYKVAYAIQKAIEFFTKKFEGEHMTRRPLRYVEAAGMTVAERERLGRVGIVERVVAVKR
ncbi:MAG: class I SAM-dependent methyltransferase [Actinomycetota bacterium]